MLSRKSVLMLSLLAAASFNAAACYTVYDRSGRVAYQGIESPVDMSLPLHSALEARYPGGHMIFEQGARCEPVSLAQQQPRVPVVEAVAMASVPNTAVMGAGPANGKVVRSAARAGVTGAPMLTDIRTASAMNLPYRVLSGDIVVVPGQAAAGVDFNTVNVVPSVAPASAQVAATRTRGETVITELHNPPMTVVQKGPDMMVSAARY